MADENYFSENKDLQYHFQQTIDWKRIVSLAERDYQDPDGFKSLEEALEFYRDILNNVGKFIPKEVLPRASAIDQQGCKIEAGEVHNPKELDEIIAMCKELGLHSLILPREFGGLNVPFTIQCMLIEMFCRIDLSSYTHISFYNAIGQFLLMFSLLEGSTEIKQGQIVKTRFQKAIEEIASGENWGAMVLTEPNAGSDLGNIHTKATRQGEAWVLNGRKMFITEGHGEHHIVLARNAEAKSGLGLDGLSLFYVPRHRETEAGRIDNFIVENIEHKMGLNGSPTCSLVYENSYAELIGEEGQGFTQMVRMMNGFRLGVGFQCLGLIQGAFSMAKAYAETRVTMGKPIIEHELIADMLFNMETDLCGLRAMAYKSVSEFELAQREEMYFEHDDTFQGNADEKKRRGDENRRRKRYVRKITPLLKYLGAEKAVEVCRFNMQIHGGFGYTKEYKAERLLRDALVLPVYEGTSQIQALMTLKDEMKNILKRPGVFCKKYLRSYFYFLPFQSSYQKALKRGRYLLFKSLKQLLFGMIREKRKHTRKTPGGFWKVLTFRYLKHWDPKQDFAFGLLHAERICRMMSKLEIAKILVEQAELHQERVYWAERYLKKIIPEIAADATIIDEGSLAVLDWITRHKQNVQNKS